MEQSIFDAVVYWHWLALAAAFVALEIVVPGVFLIFLGIAAAASGVLLLLIPGLDWRLQLVIFAALGVALIFLGRRIYGRMSEAEDHTALNRRGERFVGEIYPLAGDMVGGRGRVRVGDTDWLVRAAPDAPDAMPDGAMMRVVGIEGVTLVVAPKALGQG